MKMRFEDIKRNAVKKWNKSWYAEKPLLLIGDVTCGRSSGALETLESFRQEIKSRNIDCNLIEVGFLVEKGGEYGGK